jgi:hypothetical protein
MLKEKILDVILISKSDAINGISAEQLIEKLCLNVSKVEMNYILTKVYNFNVDQADKLIHDSNLFLRISDEKGRIDLTDDFEEVCFYEDFF